MSQANQNAALLDAPFAFQRLIERHSQQVASHPVNDSVTMTKAKDGGFLVNARDTSEFLFAGQLAECLAYLQRKFGPEPRPKK